MENKYFSSVCGLWLLQTLSVCMFICVCLSVCPAFTAYITLTMCRILIKLGENVGTLVRLIVLKFHKNQFGFDVIMTSFHFFFSKLFLRKATLLKSKRLCSKGNNYAAPDCDTSDSDLLVH